MKRAASTCNRRVPGCIALAVVLASGCGEAERGESRPTLALPQVATMSLIPLPELGRRKASATHAARSEGAHITSDEPAARAPRAEAPIQGAAHPVFDLGDNRLLAHWYRDGGLHVAAGSAGFVRYAQPIEPGRRSIGWEMSEREDGVPVARIRKAATMSVPLDEVAAGQAGSIALRVYSRRSARLSIVLNGGAPTEVTLARGWQVASVPIAADRWRTGENGVRLALRGISEVAVAWLRVGGTPREEAERGGDKRPDPDRALSFYDRGNKSLVLTARDQLVYYLYLPEYAMLGGRLVGEGPDAASCRLNVRARSHLASVDGELSQSRPRVDLDGLAGRVARVRLELRGCQRARLEGGALLVPGPAARRRSAPPPRHVLLWIMDTLRADRIRPIQPRARPEVPALERMAREGAVFRQAYVQGNESNTSHASLWTSVYPARHGVRTAGVGGVWNLNSRLTTIGQQIDKAGLWASGVTGNGMITKGGGYARGFDSFQNMMRERGRLNAWIPGQEIYERALGTIEKRHDDPFFLFVGTIDTHKPWIGHEPWLSQYDPEEYEGPFLHAARAGDLGIKRGTMRCTRLPAKRDLARINAIYDSDVSYQDRVFGQMLDKLDKWGIADQTMVIVTADHGEELWEDGRCGHGASLRETLVHVPLFVRYPPLIKPGTVVEEGVEVLDVMPTLADALGLPPPQPSQGQSLVPLMQGVGRGYPRPSYASQYEYAHTMRVGSWKIWLTPKGGLKLYDLGADPAERSSVAGRSIEARYMMDLLHLFLAHRDMWKKREWGVVNNMTAAAPAALERAFRRGERRR